MFQWLCLLKEGCLSLVYWILLAHVLGDFYFQTERLSVLVRNEADLSVSSPFNLRRRPYLLVHALFYYLAALIVLNVASFYGALPVLDAYVFAVMMAVFHLLIDLLMKGPWMDIVLGRVSSIFFFDLDSHRVSLVKFFVDQFLHFLSFVLMFSLFDFYESVVMSSWLLGLIGVLLLMKPANIVIRLVLAKYLPDKDEVDGHEGAGRLIGNLERILYMVVIASNLYIGFAVILSIKGFARYKQIGDDPKFAEYFTLGTFLSLLITFIVGRLLLFMV